MEKKGMIVMKRYGVMVIVLSLVVLLCGCGGGISTPEVTLKPETAVPNLCWGKFLELYHAGAYPWVQHR